MPLTKVPTREVDRIAGLSASTSAAGWPGIPAGLWDHQCEALTRARAAGGLVADLPVGSGKTLITYLLPTVCDLERPLLVVPAALYEKTRADFTELKRQGYPTPAGLEITKYSTLSLDRENALLERLAPDGIIADEAHKLANLGAGCTRKVARYLEAHPSTRFYALSGTLLGKSLLELGHLCAWALGQGSPLPLGRSELWRWSQAVDLDQELLAQVRRDPTRPLPIKWDWVRRCRLEQLKAAEDADDPQWPRAAVGRRIRTAPGVVSLDTTAVDAKLTVREVAPLVLTSPPIDAVLEQLRGTWSLPSGETFDQASAMWRHATTMALGVYYHWQPAPPPEWVEARRNWHLAVRSTIDRGRYDTPRAVEMAVVAGKLPAIAPALEAWRAVRGFKPRSVPVWIDRDAPALQFAAEWVAEGPGLVWVRHTAIGKRLASMIGCGFYNDGRRPPPGSAVLSIDAYHAGHNLQAWNRSLVVEPPADAGRWEQLIGRTYRSGQLRDVTVDVCIFTPEAHNSLTVARHYAKVIGVMRRYRPLLLRGYKE